ncbi:UNVERIFIED_CONTAM: GTP-binding protein Di-Ras2 [Trichonephila clavipes]
MQRLNISKGHAFILVYSITSKQSLEELAPIFALIREVKGNLEGIPMMLVGNKSDEEESREVPYQDGMNQSHKWNCNFMETSAKNNTNVKEMFQELLNMEKSRNVSLQSERRTLAQFRKEKMKGKCLIM